ncbi:MAG: helix-turn-helix transcriptional regulator [Anaerolineae bacterium]|nr:helix-turn-helix transcriptional regulator [Anaerolineae bacterium]
MIQDRFAILLEEKRVRDQQRWPIREIQRETGIATDTVRAWRRGTVRRMREPTIINVCEFLECGIDDLLVYVEDE